MYWYARRAPGVAKTLVREVRADVAIVGGGVAGLSCAQRLRAAGVSVVVLERDFCGAGASGKSSGFVTPASEIQLGSLIASRGREEARRIWDFVCSGVEAIRANILAHELDCDYEVQDSLFVANDGAGWRAVQAEHRARLELGYPSRLYDARALPEVLTTTRYAGGVRYGSTFAIDAYAYCQELRDVLVSQGVRIFEGSRVTRLDADGVEAAAGRVRAGHVVVCTDRFIPELGALGRDIYHVQTCLAVSSSLSEADVHKVFTSDRAMTWDSDLVYRYFRMIGGNRLLLGGGDLRHTYARAPMARMDPFVRRASAYLRAKFPDLAVRVEYAWPGMLGISKDLLPIMRPDPVHDRIWYVGAATGLPWAAALGVYAAERILTGRTDFDDAFSPERKFVIGHRLQAFLSTPLTFAISHGIARYS